MKFSHSGILTHLNPLMVSYLVHSGLYRWVSLPVLVGQLHRNTHPDRRMVDELRVLIEKHFKDHHNPLYYSKQLHISLKRLNRLTNYYHQKTVYELLQHRLHHEAELLLKHTTLTAKEIAFELGVCDPAHFSKCFKKLTGKSPLQYRRKNHLQYTLP